MIKQTMEESSIKTRITQEVVKTTKKVLTGKAGIADRKAKYQNTLAEEKAAAKKALTELREYKASLHVVSTVTLVAISSAGGETVVNPSAPLIPLRKEPSA